jgi:hypothetical protein
MAANRTTIVIGCYLQDSLDAAKEKSTDSSKNKKLAKVRNKLGGGLARGKSRKQK